MARTRPASPCFRARLLMGAVLSLLVCGLAHAEESLIALLGFDVQSLTSTPVSDADRQRASALSQQLLDELQELTGQSVTLLAVENGDDSETMADGVFDHPARAGDLGRASDASWLVSCRLLKDEEPTVFLRAQLIEVEGDRIAADFVVEADGDEPANVDRGINTLATQIDDTLRTLEVIP